ncbi:recombinase [Bacillus thuringiensis]|nr:recombinase [Bacillus thuringiensis]
MEETYPKWQNGELTGVKFGAIETKEKYFYKIVKEYGENEVATNL